MADPTSYTEAVEQAQVLVRGLLGKGRLADPDEHYPYKHGVVTRLLVDNPPMGPDGPDDDRLQAIDYMSAEIAEASRRYVDAQAAMLADLSDPAARRECDQMRDELIAARQAHRYNRPAGATIIGIRARRAGE